MRNPPQRIASLNRVATALVAAVCTLSGTWLASRVTLIAALAYL